MKKTVALLLILCLAVLPLVACGGGAETTAPTGTKAPTSESRTIIETKTPAGTNFNGEKIKILSRGDDDYIDEISLKPEEVKNIIDDSILQREAYVEEKIGVDIVNEKVLIANNYAQLTDTIREHFRSNLDEFQLMANNYYHSMDASLEGCFWNLEDIETIDLDMPWYAQYFIEEARTQDGLYFVTGDAALSRLRFVFATFFNKELLAQFGTYDLYKMVDDGEWTIDAQAEIVSGIYSDENGSNVRDEGDIFGLGTYFILGVDPYWSSFDLKLVGRDGDFFVEAMDDTQSERMVDALTKINKLFHENTGTYIVPRNGADLELIDAMRMFSSNNFAFMTNRLIAVESEYLTDMENAYGILPMPMLNLDQDDYYSYSHDLMSCFGVPGTAPEADLDMIGVVLEELSAYSYNYTREAYFEIALKGRYARDAESRRMLDIIVDNLRINAGEIYSKVFGDIALTIRDLVKSNNSNWTRIYRSKKSILQNGLDKLNGLK